MSEVDVWRALSRALSGGSPCALLAVADSQGSSPGRPGAVMAVASSGPLAGTVGGGVAEAVLVDRVASQLRADRLQPHLVAMDHREGAPDASGLICGGTQVVVVSPLGVGDLPGVQRILAALTSGRSVAWRADANGWAVGGGPVAARAAQAADGVAQAADGVAQAADGVAPPDRTHEWTHGVGGAAEPDGVGEAADTAGRADWAHLGTASADPGPASVEGWAPALTVDERRWTYHHLSGPTHVVHVIGGGHVGAALAPVLVGLDFRVVLVEERDGLASLRSEVAAHEHIRAPYEDLARIVPAGPTSFAAIMAHSHDRDAAALAALAPVDLGYLGLLGSRAKVRRVVGGRTMPPWFHAPMGLPIGSVTPAEIAVSVAAEMVAVRSSGRSRTRTG